MATANDDSTTTQTVRKDQLDIHCEHVQKAYELIELAVQQREAGEEGRRETLIEEAYKHMMAAGQSMSDMRVRNQTLPYASSSLHDDLSNFLGEVRGIADLMIAASDHPGFQVDDSTYLHVASGLYYRAGAMKKRLDGDAS